MIEGSPFDHDFYNLLIDYLQGKPVHPEGLLPVYRSLFEKVNLVGRNISLKELEQKTSSGTVATIEVLLTCRLRNINVVPLEVQVYRSKLQNVRARNQNLTIEEAERVGPQREAGAIKRIVKTLSKGNRELFVLCGAYHMPFLRNGLVNLGIASEIKIDLFKNRKFYEKWIERYVQIRSEVLSGNQNGIREQYNDEKRILLDDAFQYENTAHFRLKSLIDRVARNQQARLQTKLKEHRDRFTVLQRLQQKPK